MWFSQLAVRAAPGIIRVAGFFQTFDTHGYPKTTEIGTSSTNHTRRVILDYDFNPATLNLLSRTKRTDNGSTTVASETFTYDPLDRLTGWDVTVGSQTQNYHLNYANNGNITQKSDMGVYQYYSDKPNAVTNVSNLRGSRVNTYENNIQYTPFNKISSINIMQSGYEFGLYTMTYGPDDQRRKSNHYDYVDNIFTHTIYSGLYEERSTGEQLHYIPTPAGIGAVLVTHKNIPSQKDFYYLYNDHLGSLIAATKRGSTVLEEFSYDPWGKKTQPQQLE
jgi:YD repeat-containing protein